MQSAPMLRAIIGTGRSGTTWLGSLVDTHPDAGMDTAVSAFHR
ncbi:MAG: hypothetical protein ACFB9M_21460 [Myxococcota bacterium]